MRQAAWKKARADDDFAAFAPLLERTMELQREIAEHVGYGGHPYDALVQRFRAGNDLGEAAGTLRRAEVVDRPLLAARCRRRRSASIFWTRLSDRKQKAFSK